MDRAEDGPELGAGELGHLRGAFAADLDQPFGTGQREPCPLEGAVDVGPVGGDLKHLDVGGLRPSAGLFGAGQGLVGVEGVDVSGGGGGGVRVVHGSESIGDCRQF